MISFGKFLFSALFLTLVNEALTKPAADPEALDDLTINVNLKDDDNKGSATGSAPGSAPEKSSQPALRSPVVINKTSIFTVPNEGILDCFVMGGGGGRGRFNGGGGGSGFFMMASMYVYAGQHLKVTVGEGGKENQDGQASRVGTYPHVYAKGGEAGKSNVGGGSGWSGGGGNGQEYNGAGGENGSDGEDGYGFGSLPGGSGQGFQLPNIYTKFGKLTPGHGGNACDGAGGGGGVTFQRGSDNICAGEGFGAGGGNPSQWDDPNQVNGKDGVVILY